MTDSSKTPLKWWNHVFFQSIFNKYIHFDLINVSNLRNVCVFIMGLPWFAIFGSRESYPLIPTICSLQNVPESTAQLESCTVFLLPLSCFICRDFIQGKFFLCSSAYILPTSFYIIGRLLVRERISFNLNVNVVSGIISWTQVHTPVQSLRISRWRIVLLHYHQTSVWRVDIVARGLPSSGGVCCCNVAQDDSDHGASSWGSFKAVITSRNDRCEEGWRWGTKQQTVMESIEIKKLGSRVIYQDEGLGPSHTHTHLGNHPLRATWGQRMTWLKLKQSAVFRHMSHWADYWTVG